MRKVSFIKFSYILFHFINLPAAAPTSTSALEAAETAAGGSRGSAASSATAGPAEVLEAYV